MKIKIFDGDITVCKIKSTEGLDLEKGFYFLAKTDEELSLVCITVDAPGDTTDREDGWRALRIEGVLDFSLVGILARITGVLAECGIGLFAVSTFNTDYILVKKENLEKARAALKAAGYEID